MAFTLHWPNECGQRYIPNEQQYQNLKPRRELFNRICGIQPSLSVQADVLYPNAEADVSKGVDGTVQPSGCVGHQLDNPFPVEPRTPVPLPLVMYPAQTEIVDICALPVINWENYVQELNSSARIFFTYFYPSFHKTDRRVQILKKRRLAVQNAMKQNTAAVTESKQGTSGRGLPTLVPFLPRKGKGRAPPNSLASTRRALLAAENTPDLEVTEHELSHQNSVKRNIKPEAEVDAHANEIPFPLASFGSGDRHRLGKTTVKKYIYFPKVKIQGTWNYLYNGTGACNWINDSKSSGFKHLFVGNGTKLRMLSLEPTKSTQMLSYSVQAVWEEDEIPSNVNLAAEDSDDRLNSQIFQIKTLRKRNLIGVRRGKSIEMYLMNSEGIPSLLASIPNVGYGFSTSPPVKPRVKKPSPFLTSFDVNSNFPSEIVTMDENGIIRFIDITQGRVTKQVDGMKRNFPRDDGFSIGPKNFLNESTGLSYTGNHPQVIYYWSESNIYMHDERVKNGVQTRELFNLRSSMCTSTFSDHDVFRYKNQRMAEYISTFTTSANPLYYYFGTTQRIFSMDVRVPRNPVIRLSHGLASPPAYMDTLADDNFETLVAGTQRNAEIFCAFFDRGHVNCLERPDCQQRNPILQCPPRHLSNSREFNDFVLEQQFNCDWESDYQRAKAQCNLWTTGLCLMKPSKIPMSQTLPSSFILFNGNSMGDVFVQEWDQKPILTSRKAEISDERLKNFLCQWRDYMTTPLDTVPKPPEPSRYCDHSLLMESAVEMIKTSDVIRSLPFDPFTPHGLVCHRVQRGLPSLQDQISQLNPSAQTERAQRFLRMWSGSGPRDDDIPPMESSQLEPFQSPGHTHTDDAKEEIVEDLTYY